MRTTVSMLLCPQHLAWRIVMLKTGFQRKRKIFSCGGNYYETPFPTLCQENGTSSALAASRIGQADQDICERSHSRQASHVQRSGLQNSVELKQHHHSTDQCPAELEHSPECPARHGQSPEQIRSPPLVYMFFFCFFFVFLSTKQWMHEIFQH